MKKFTKDLSLGILLVAVGFLFLLINLNVIELSFNGTIFVGLIFFAGFLVFIGIYFYKGRKEFWPIIPGIILLGLSLLLFSENIGIGYQNGSAIFILFIGLSFIIVFLFHRENWWALIPGGINASVSFVIFINGIVGTGLMFMGMGATFLILYPILKKTEPNSWWTLIPGSILAVFGIFLITFESKYIGHYLVPLLFIVIGIVIILKSMKKAEIEKR